MQSQPSCYIILNISRNGGSALGTVAESHSPPPSRRNGVMTTHTGYSVIHQMRKHNVIPLCTRPLPILQPKFQPEGIVYIYLREFLGSKCRHRISLHPIIQALLGWRIGKTNTMSIHDESMHGEVEGTTRPQIFHIFL